MKTLTEIKKVCCFNRFSLFIVALSLITTFTACSKDDDSDSPIPVYSLKDVEGTYSGLMMTESVPVVNPQLNAEEGDGEKPVGIEVKAEVKDNQIVINKLPVDALIKSIITDESQAEKIIKNIGDVNCKIPYTPTFDDNKSNILLKLKPEPIEIKFTTPSPEPQANEEANEVIIKVTIEAEQNGNYAYDGSKLTFTIKATEVKVGEEPFEFPATTFSFDMAKK